MKKILFYSLCCLMISACANAPKRAVTTPTPPPVAHKSLEIPDDFSGARYEQKVAELLALDDAHPDRLALRDALIAWTLKRFDADDTPSEKLRLFQNALNWHLPSDFTVTHINVDMVPMAHWVIEHYEKRGKEAWVLAALIYLSLAQPENLAWHEEYLTLMDWTEGVRATIEDPIERYSSIAGVYMDIIVMLPLPELIDKISLVLARRQTAVVALLHAIQEENATISPLLFHSLIQRGGVGQELVHAHFLGGLLHQVVPKFKELGVYDNISDDLLALIENIESGQNLSESYQKLSFLLGHSDPTAALRACMLARSASPRDPLNALCVARYFNALSYEESAAAYFHEAVHPDFEEPILLQALSGLRQVLIGLHQKEQVDAAERTIVLAESVIQTLEGATDRSQELQISMAALAEICAQIAFNDGRIASAQALFATAMRLWPSMPSPYLKLAEIHLSRQEGPKAIEVLTSALASKRSVGGDFRNYWRAMVLESRGDVYRHMGNERDADDDYQSALETWATAEYPMEQEAEIEIRKGIIHDRLGNPDASLTHFQRAIRVDPERRASYAEVISFLVMRQRLADARSFYQLAFNQDRIDTMWKIYYALWVEGLARRQNERTFDLPNAYLQDCNGTSWQDQLARFFTGRIPYDKLRALADNLGQQVEADFYEAVLRLSSGETASARAMLQQVIASDLLGFFEYRMAAELLVEP
ncbi:MAG: tetratricopeptide repeat protein [Proteobacteria bacterium]|nr:tetratricopeptide repeat protein [Pseudomonadota bacterium]NLN61404.1 tetratricopeptide repeat protein [Myxococcales bacterium]